MQSRECLWKTFFSWYVFAALRLLCRHCRHIQLVSLQVGPQVTEELEICRRKMAVQS